MAQRPIAVLGECVADAFADRHQPRPGELALRVLPGGGPANTAVALARLGTPTRFLGRISTDAFGALFRAHLAASGVDLSDAVTAPEPSTLAIATFDAHGQAQYSFHAEATADWQWTGAELAAARPEDAACLHTGSLALVRAPGDEHIEEALLRVRGGATVSIDPNVRPLLVEPALYRQRLPHWCALPPLPGRPPGRTPGAADRRRGGRRLPVRGARRRVHLLGRRPEPALGPPVGLRPHHRSVTTHRFDTTPPSAPGKRQP